MSKSLQRILFAGNGFGAVMALKSIQDNFLNVDILSNSDEVLSLKRRAQDAIVTDIQQSSASYVICAGYLKIIPKALLEKKTFINTHPSLLPKYRGLHALVWAMLNEEKEYGFTVHLINGQIDDGAILQQFKVAYNGETSQELMQKFHHYVRENLGTVVLNFINSKIIPQKQNKSLATWVAKRNIHDCLVDFNSSLNQMNMFFKALVRPYPLPMLKVKGMLYEISLANIIEKKYVMTNGRVVNIDSTGAYIKFEEGLLLVKELICFETQITEKAENVLKLGQRL